MTAPALGRRFWWTALAVALLCAGGASYVASSSPDGLESVADRLGFADAGRASASGLGGYAIPGLGRLGEGLAGVLGVITVLALFTGLTWLLRRRRVADEG